jgi:nicotinamide mononucleotide transporter PnuC
MSAKSTNIVSEYWQWIVGELSQMAKPMVMLFGLGAGFQLALYLSGAHTVDTTVTFLATVISLLCVTSMSSGFAINGLIGAISVFLLVYVDLKAHLYASAIDQLIFLALIDIPLMVRWRTWSDDLRTKARVLKGDGWLVIAIFATLAFVIYEKFTLPSIQYGAIGLAIIASIVYAIRNQHRFKGVEALVYIAISIAIWLIILNPLFIWLKDSSPLWDSAVLTIGALASYLNFRFYTNTYDLWMLSNMFNLVLWFSAWQTGLADASLPMLVSSIMFTANAVYGRWFSVWREGAKKAIA